jgi:hypothetical protein
MTLLDAKELDPEKARVSRRRYFIIVGIIIAVLVLGALGALLGYGWWFQYWPKQRIVGHFFSDLQRQDFKSAYGIWWQDPNWQQHPEKYSKKYPFSDFYRDWGPGGEWGLIKTYKVYGASTCPNLGGGSSSGVLVDVVVNDRTEHAQVWVEKSDKTLSFPPCELIFH